MADNAKDQVKAILAETQRRKRIWARMQQAARESVTAVTAQARHRGIRGQNWVGGQFDLEHTYVSFPTLAFRMAELSGPKEVGRLSHAERQHSFRLHGSGTLERPDKGDAYEGYPDLAEDDPQRFREAAVRELMVSLNTYIQKQGGRRGRRK